MGCCRPLYSPQVGAQSKRCSYPCFSRIVFRPHHSSCMRLIWLLVQENCYKASNAVALAISLSWCAALQVSP